MCLFVFIHLSLGRRMLCMINLSCECFNMLVAIERFYLSVCQHVRVQICDSDASVVALLLCVRPHSYLKTLCVCMQVQEWLHLCAFIMLRYAALLTMAWLFSDVFLNVLFKTSTLNG